MVLRSVSNAMFVSMLRGSETNMRDLSTHAPSFTERTMAVSDKLGSGVAFSAQVKEAVPFESDLSSSVSTLQNGLWAFLQR